MIATERVVSRISRAMSYALRIELACHISVYSLLATSHQPRAPKEIE